MIDPIPLSPQAITHPLGLGPLPPHRGIRPIGGDPLIGLAPLGTFPYLIDIGGGPVYLDLGRCEGRPGHPHLVPGPLQPLPQIVYLIFEPSDGLDPGITLYIPCLSHHPIGLVELPYEQLIPVPSAVPLNLIRPQPLTEIPPSPQQGIEPPLPAPWLLIPATSGSPQNYSWHPIWRDVTALSILD